MLNTEFRGIEKLEEGVEQAADTMIGGDADGIVARRTSFFDANNVLADVVGILPLRVTQAELY